MSDRGASPSVVVGQTFGLGITVGVVLGFALGTFAALVLGQGVVGGFQRLINHLTGGDDHVNFELLLQ